MESGAISDMQIRGSSEYDWNYAAVQARLNYNVPGKFGGWSARTNDKNQWLQVDLLSHFTKVTRVATQGRRDVSQWVTKYNLKYGKNGLNFLYYRESRKKNDKVKDISPSSSSSSFIFIASSYVGNTYGGSLGCIDNYNTRP